MLSQAHLQDAQQLLRRMAGGVQACAQQRGQLPPAAALLRGLCVQHLRCTQPQR